MQAIPEILKTCRDLRLDDANEAETRLKIIDRVLFDVLNWTHSDVNVETRISEDKQEKYADYAIRTAGTSLLIEAKRVGPAPLPIPNSRRHRLNAALLKDETGKAIRQVRDYCRSESIPFAVVTNGDQWIIFPATRTDQIRFSESSAVLFPSIESALRDHYSEFTDLLSRESVIGGSLETTLLGRQEDQYGDRRLGNYFSNRGTAPSNNPLYPLIEDAVVQAFTDSLLVEPDLLRKCYVQTAERKKFDREVNFYLTKRRPDFEKTPRRPQTRKDTRALDEVLNSSQSKARATAILVVGTVGAGKTTFLNYTRYVSCKDVFETHQSGPYPHWIYVDFLQLSPDENPTDYLYSTLDQYITDDEFFSNYEQCIRPAYISEIRSITSGPAKLISKDEDDLNRRIVDFLMDEKKSIRYIDKLLRYAASKKPVYLVVDNVDQFGEAEKQSKIFAAAIAIASRNNLNLIISLRDATFVRHRFTSTFDAFDFNPIYIDPPPIQAVLARRFFLLGELLKGRSGSFIAENGAHIQIEDLSLISELLSSSVLGTNVAKVIDVLSTSDVRLALRITREFLESGYSNPGRAVQKYRKHKKYVLPRHEALRAVLLGKQRVYSEQYSVIGNPFDARLSLTKLQGLRLFILSALVNLGSQKDFQSLDGDDLQNSMRELGVADAHTLEVLNDLCKYRFVLTTGHTEPTLSSSYRGTLLGAYVLRDLLAELQFLEAMMMDTFIPHHSKWELLKQRSEEIESERDARKRVDLRITRAKEYYGYMEEIFLPLLKEAQRRGLGAEWLGNPFEDMSERLNRNMRQIRRSAQRTYRPSQRR